MNKLIFALFVAVSIFFVSVSSAKAYVRVRSYYKPSTGRYVQSYYRTNYNYTKLDNFSTRGNYNIFTGSKGYKSWY